MAVKPFLFQDVFKRIVSVGWGESGLWMGFRYFGLDEDATYDVYDEFSETYYEGYTTRRSPDYFTITGTDPFISRLNGKNVGFSADWFEYVEGGTPPIINFDSEMTEEIQKNVIAFHLGNRWTQVSPIDTEFPFFNATATLKEGMALINVSKVRQLWRDLYPNEDDKDLLQAIIDANKQKVTANIPSAPSYTDTVAPDAYDDVCHMVGSLFVIKPGTKIFTEYDFGGGEGEGRAFNEPEFNLDIQADRHTFWGKWGDETYLGPWTLEFNLKKNPDVPPDEAYTITAIQG